MAQSHNSKQSFWGRNINISDIHFLFFELFGTKAEYRYLLVGVAEGQRQEKEWMLRYHGGVQNTGGWDDEKTTRPTSIYIYFEVVGSSGAILNSWLYRRISHVVGLHHTFFCFQRGRHTQGT